MQAAPQIPWLSPAHVGILSVSILYLLAYVIGLPVFYAYILISHKRKGALQSPVFLQRYGWLTERYTRRFWW